MSTISVAEAQSHLAEIIENLPAGEELVITRDDQPVATLRATKPAPRRRAAIGNTGGSILYIAPDFDAIPEGFEDYLP